MTKANKPLIVCFPFLDWISGHGLSSESVMVYGPNLAAAYESLGTQAGMYLNAPITYSFAFSMLPSSYLFGK